MTEADTQGVQTGAPIGSGSKYDELWELNAKRTYDEYQQESLETIRRSRDAHDALLGDGRTNTNQLNNVALQALQNAVETANLVSKQAVQHRDLAVDRQWNLPDQSLEASSLSKESTFKDAIRAEMQRVANQLADIQVQLNKAG